MRSAAGWRKTPSPETLGLSRREALNFGMTMLHKARVENPWLDSQLLLAEALGVSRERLITDDPLIDELTFRRFRVLLERREAREPIAYILGRKEFRRITLAVDRRVLIPRPETELLVDVALTLATGARVVDVGTGSGAVALAVKDERPDLEVWGTDVSEEALGVARENAARLGLEVRFKRADLLGGVRGRFDAVLANLPYVEIGARLEPEIENYEPARALFAGSDGLEVIRRLLSMAAEVPLLALEVGAGQARAVGALVRDAGWASVETLRDLGGHERVVLGRR